MRRPAQPIPDDILEELGQLIERTRQAKVRPMAPEDRLYNTPAAAEFLQLSISTLERFRRLGVGPRWIRIGTKMISYTEADLRAWRDSRAFRGPEQAKAAQAEQEGDDNAPRN